MSNPPFAQSLVSSLASSLSQSIAGSSGVYTTTASDYDGTNDYATRGADLTGNADSGKGVIAFWFRVDGGDGATRILYRVDNTRVFVQLNSSNQLFFRIIDTLGNTLASLTSTTTYAAGAAWYLVIVAWDTSNATSAENYCYLYVGDTQEAADEDISQAAVDSTGANHGIGAVSSDGSLKFNGCLSELFIHYGATLDISVEVNRRKFIDANGKPVSLGADGSTPLGVQPLVYAPNGDPSDNKGSGGDFTITGALDVCSSSPSD